ncbi:MAG: helix-turn-helix domain-containing protein, partial [Clostridiaceae bacterium]|nr:helix-turn-helix domain-containing protein [Clostridiaceae bacterium]
MSTYFSIGEIAKMFNISTQTLRLYDRMDLIKPAHINEDNGYRYYSIEQFIKLDCIKLCKSMGLSLEEIKGFIGNESSIKSILDITRKHQVTLENKIKELESMKSNLDSFENRIEESIKTGFNKIVLVDNEERALIRYSYLLRTQEELELNLRKVIL